MSTSRMYRGDIARGDIAHHHPRVRRSGTGSWVWACDCGSASCRTAIAACTWRLAILAIVVTQFLFVHGPVWKHVFHWDWAIFASYLGTQLISTKFFGLPLGVYQHYFNLLLPPIDVLFSFIQVVVFAVVVTLVHCYYGYYATGGPVGVGTATGRAIRFSFMSIAVLNMVLSFAFYGSGGARLVG